MLYRRKEPCFFFFGGKFSESPEEEGKRWKGGLNKKRTKKKRKGTSASGKHFVRKNITQTNRLCIYTRGFFRFLFCRLLSSSSLRLCIRSTLSFRSIRHFYLQKPRVPSLVCAHTALHNQLPKTTLPTLTFSIDLEPRTCNDVLTFTNGNQLIHEMN